MATASVSNSDSVSGQTLETICKSTMENMSCVSVPASESQDPNPVLVPLEEPITAHTGFNTVSDSGDENMSVSASETPNLDRDLMLPERPITTHSGFNTAGSSVEASMSCVTAISSTETSMHCNAESLFGVKTELAIQNSEHDDCNMERIQDGAFTDAKCEQDGEQTNNNMSDPPADMVLTTALYVSNHTGEGGQTVYAGGTETATQEQPTVHAGGKRYHPYPCQHCPVAYTSQVSLTNHIIRAHTGSKPSQASVSTVAAQGQPATPTGDKPYPYSCPHCPVAYTSESLLTNHITRTHSHIDNKSSCPYTCSQCPVAYKSQMSLTNHMARTHHKVGKAQLPHACEHCPAAFQNERSLEIHTRRTHPYQYRHEHCSSAFKQDKSLKRHTERTQTSPYSCDYCLLTFEKEKSLQVHIAESHMMQTEKPYPYSCSQCPAAFTKLTLLKWHVSRSHAGVKLKPYSCTQCPETFRFSQSLEAHKRIFEGLKSHPQPEDQTMPEQPKTIENESSRSCTGKATFACSQCSATFRQQRSLKLHEASHNRKSFTCPHCQLAFANMTDLKQHTTQCHAGSMKYHCCLCPAVFTEVSQCMNHIKRHTEASTGPNLHQQGSETVENPASLRDHCNVHTAEQGNPLSPILSSTQLSGGQDGAERVKPSSSSYQAGFVVSANFNEDDPKQLKPLYQFSCPQCPIAFKYKSFLMNHIMRVHRGKKLEEKSGKFVLAE